MNIAFDAKRIFHNTTGLGNYSRFLLRTLIEYAPENNYLLSSYHEGERALYEEFLEHRAVSLLTAPKTYPFGEALWRNFGQKKLLREWDVDVYHGLTNELPMGLWGKNRRMRTVVTIHDLIFYHHPEYYPLVDRYLYKFKYLESARHADLVIAVSERTKYDLMKLVGIPEEKIMVVYQGCSRRFAHIPPIKEEWVRRHYQLPGDYLLYVGSIEERKNLLLAIEALALLPKEVHLVAVGKKTPYADRCDREARRLGVEKRVHMLYGIDDDTLLGLYRGAKVFVYPSRYEGFGIPVIEAITAHVPVVAATGSVLEEAGGPASLYTDPDDAEMLAGMISQFLFDENFRRDAIQQSSAYIRRFSPKQISRSLRDAYSKVMIQ